MLLLLFASRLSFEALVALQQSAVTLFLRKMAKKKAKMVAPCAAPSKSSNGLAHNAEESCVMEDHPSFDEEWSKPFDTAGEDEEDSEWSQPPAGSPEAFYYLANRIQSYATVLCKALTSAGITERKRRSYEIVAEMSETLQRFEKDMRPTFVTTDYSYRMSAPTAVAVRPNTMSTTAVKAVQQVIGKPAGAESMQQVIGKPAGAESIKPGRSGISGEPTSMDSDGIDDWSDPVNADGSTSIFMGDIPMAATVDQLQVIIGVEAEIVR